MILSFRSRSGDLAAILFLASFTVVCYLPVALGQQVFAEGDINWLFAPIRTELARALAEARLPLWSPGLQAGFPLFAEGEVAALYPLNLIAYRLFPVYTAGSLTVLFNFIFASVGMYLLVRSAGLQIAGGLLAGLVFGSGGFMIAHLSHLPHVAVAAWLPWLILFLQRYWRRRAQGRQGELWLGWAAVGIALQWLAGFPQIAIMNVMVYSIFGVLAPLIWTKDSGLVPTRLAQRRAITTAAIATLGTVAVGTGLAAVQWLPTLELMGLSIRAQEMGKAFSTSYSLSWMELTQLVAPFWQLRQPDAANMEYWGYIGVLPLILALTAPMLRRSTETIVFAVVGLLALALALGGNLPFTSGFYDLPILNRFRVPARFLFVFTFAAGYLAALGLEEICKLLKARKESSVVLPAAGLVGALVIAIIHQTYNQSLELWIEVWRVLPLVLVGCASCLLLLVWFKRIPSTACATFALGLVLVDLTAFRAPFLQTLTGLAPPTEWIQPPRTVLAMDNSQSDYRVYEDKIPNTIASLRATLWGNLPLIFGKQGVNSYLPSLGIQRYKSYIEQLSIPKWNLLNIRYYLLPLEMPDYADAPPSPLDGSEPETGLTPALMSEGATFSPQLVSQIELTSYTDNTRDLPDGYAAGELVLGLGTGSVITQPIRLGIDTADWAYDSFQPGQVRHHKPPTELSFPAYLKALGRTFNGYRYIARFDIGTISSPIAISSIAIRSSLAPQGLTVERVRLINPQGQPVSLAQLIGRNDLSLAFRSHTAAMWENENYLPRAFLVHRAQVLPDAPALAALSAPDFQPEKVVVLEEPPNAPVPEDVTLGTNDRVTITEYHPERVELQATTGASGYLVLADSWYPGWVAQVDGEETPIIRADYMFRAVHLEPGIHTVVFEFRPGSLQWGLVISGMSLAVGLLGLVLAKRSAG